MLRLLTIFSLGAGGCPALLSALALAACSTGVTRSVSGEMWVLMEISGSPTIEEHRPTLVLAPDGQAYGGGGCNAFSATYDLQGDRLTVRDTEMTVIACGRPARQDIHTQEGRYLSALEGATRVSNSGDSMTLLSEDGTTLQFRRGR